MIANISFVVPCVDASVLFDFAEVVFNQMTPLVGFFIMGDVHEPVCFCRNNGLSIAIFEFFAQGIGIKCLVGKHGAEIQTVDQVWHAKDFTSLTGQQLEPHQIAQGICQGQNLGGQTAF